MQISSVDQSYLWGLYTQAKSKLAAGVAGQDQENTSGDSVSISNVSQQIANMPPPPHEMDFENLSDGELKEYLQQMYEITGIVPGATGTVDGLSEEELAQVRSTLVEMSQSGPISEMMSSEKASQFSADDFKTLLTMFMMNMQSSLSTVGESSSDKLLFSGGETDLVMQMLLERMASSLAEDGATTQKTREQQAVLAYEQNAALL